MVQINIEGKGDRNHLYGEVRVVTVMEKINVTRAEVYH